jgi:hypothetical protein
MNTLSINNINNKITTFFTNSDCIKNGKSHCCFQTLSQIRDHRLNMQIIKFVKSWIKSSESTQKKTGKVSKI